MPWYLYLAFKQLFPTGKRFSFFSIIAIIGVMLGVMILLVVLSVMNGFGDKIRETIRNTYGDIQVSNNSMLFDWEGSFEQINQFKFVEAAAPFVQGMVMLQYQSKPAFPGIRGIDFDKERKVIPLESFVVAGDLNKLDDDSIILASRLAEGIHASVGSIVEVYTPLMLQRMKENEILLPRELEVVAIIETGANEVDTNSAMCSLGLMQELYGMEEGIHGFNVKLKPGYDEERAVQAMNASLSKGLKATSWLQANEGFLMVLKLEKTMMFFIILFVILVASFSIASSLMTTVVRKTKEIGLLSAMGGRARHIAATYCCQGFIIGLSGTALGMLGALIALHFRNDIILSLAKITQTQATLERFYLFSELPAQYLASDFTIVSLFSILIATLAGLLPAIRAARLRPSEALRNE